MQLQVVHTTGKSTEITVSDAVFGAKVNKPLLAQAVRVYLSNQRQGSAKVKTRGEVNKTKKKWYRQKGTGGARHGARTPSLFVGGGVAFGPNGTQNWSKKMPKMMRRSALMSALTAQAPNIVVTTVLDSIQPKTKDAVAFLKKLAPDSKRILLVTDSAKINIQRSTNNLDWVLITTAPMLNIYETLLADKIIFTKEAIQVVEKRLLGEKESGKVAELQSDKTKEVKTQKSKIKSTSKKEKVDEKKTATKKPLKKDTEKEVKSKN